MDADAVVICETAGHIRHANRQAEAMFGYDRDELAGVDIAVLLPALVHAEQGGGADVTARRKDGTEFAAAAWRSAFETDAGAFEVVSLRDLANGPASEARFESVFDATPDAIVAVDAAGAVRLVNREAEVLFGYRRDELVGQPVDMLVSESARSRHPGHRASYGTDPVPRAMGLGLKPAGRHKDGTEFPVGVSLSSLATDEGLLVLAAVRDISDRMRAEELRGQLEASVLKVERDEERASLEGQLQQAQRLEIVGQLAGGVAHDFNNLLAGIMNYASLVSESLQDEVSRRGLTEDEAFVTLAEDIEQIKHVARRAAALTRQLLIFSQRTVVQPEVLDLNAVVADLGDMLRRTIGNNVDHLETVCEPDLPRIKADRGQIDQVVMNLAVNARDAMPGGGQLKIETSIFEADERHSRNRGIDPGTYARLSVSDTGTGMSPEVVERAFEPFFTTKAKSEGTGLGLATVYGIVREARGDVSIESEPGAGTTIRVDLPATSETQAKHRAMPPNAKPPEEGETVLLVEDEAIVREPAQRLLARHGYTVLAAPNAAAALELAAEYPGVIDLLLTDVVMPGRSGRELAIDLAALRPATKVLFMSSYSYDMMVHEVVLEAGVSIIEKPFAADDLLNKVRHVLDGNASA